MTVAYQTGAASSPGDFVTKLSTFAQANGFTAPGAASGVVLSSGSVLVGIAGQVSAVHMRGGITSAPLAAWNAQIGAPTSPAKTAVMDLGGATGPYTAYHFFVGDEDGNPHVHAVLEITAGVFRHLSFGQLVKSGTYTGGTYVEGMNWNISSSFAGSIDTALHHVIGDANSGHVNASHMRVDYDSKSNNWQDITGGSWTADKVKGSVRSEGIYGPLIAAQNMKWNARTPLYKIEYFAARPSSMWSPLGRIPNMRQLNLRSIAPGDEITIGGDTWKCFPFVQRTDAVGGSAVNSYYYGYAYLMP